MASANPAPMYANCSILAIAEGFLDMACNKAANIRPTPIDAPSMPIDPNPIPINFKAFKSII